MFKVSIILACYNVENFIDDAFRSIVTQSMFDQMEIIPVNDGSTDGTLRIIEDYQRRYPNNFFPISFEKGSGGPGRPRNAGIEKARGDYIIFMDPDDRIYKDGYSTLLKKIEAYQSDIVIATRYGVREKQGPESRAWTDYIVKEEFFNQDSYGIKLDLLSQRPVILKSIYCTAMIREHNLRFLEGVVSSEDEIFDMKYLLLAKKITKINDIVYLYTVERSGSITSQIRLNLYKDLPVIFNGLDDALSVYFPQPIVSYRLASLLRTFYFPKLLLLDPDLTDDALELVRQACEEYGFERLLLTEHSVDRRMVQLLQSRSYSQLMLYMMNQRLTAASRIVRKQRSRLKKLNRRPVKVARKLYKYVVVARRAAREGAPRKFLLALKNVLDSKPNGYWLFMDRRDKAADNAEALYRYVRENKLHDKIAFIIRADCPDYNRLQRDGFNLVTYNSFEHWRLLYNCEAFFASHVDDVIVVPWKEYQTEPLEPKYKLVFLQHGIISSDLSGWLGEKTYHIFCSTTRSEYDTLLNNIAYGLTPDTLKLTGLARHDLLERRPGEYILVSPTWRSFLTKATNAEFRASEFYSAWHDLVYSEQLREALNEAGLHLKLALHPSLDKFRQCFEETEHVKLLSYQDVESYSDLISSAQLLLTDYSTISFDALYIRRPVIYYTFPETRTHSTNPGRDVDLYRNLGYLANSHDDAINAIVTSVSQNFKLDDERARQIDAFFAFQDNANRKRIIDAVRQKEHRA